MNDSDKNKFAEIMYGLAEAFPNASISKSGLRLFYESLKNYTITDIQQSAVSILKTRTFPSMPTIAEIIQHIPGNVSAQSKAKIEADKIISHLNLYGGSRTPTYDDSITKHLMTSRWPYQRWASEVLESELKWWVKEFCEAYESYTELDGVPQIEVSKDVLKLAERIGK